MIVGPVFFREAATLPRRPKFYAGRTLYVIALFGLMVTAFILLTGSQQVKTVGDWARFGSKVFQILVPLQLAMATLLGAMLTASAVSYEKDRRTMVILLLTSLTNVELVLGRLFASLLNVLVLVACAIPLFMMTAMLGGVSFEQILHVELVTVASVIVAGSVGSTIALWREKTFQALAMTALALVLWFLAWEYIANGSLGATLFGFSSMQLASAASPWRAVYQAVFPDLTVISSQGLFSHLGGWFVIMAGAGAILLNLLSVVRVRAWNTTAPVRQQKPGAEGQGEFDEGTGRALASATTQTEEERNLNTNARKVWDNPVLWREMRTWAYGKKVLVVRAAYVVILGACFFAAVNRLSGTQQNFSTQHVPSAAQPLIPLFAVSLALINALAVTSITNERDGRALDLLLVSDLTAKEFVYGKLFGVLYNVKEMVVMPILITVYFWATGDLGLLNLFFFILGFLVLVSFSAMLGVHAGITYENSRSAVATSLGTLLFLFLGVLTCMRMMVAFKGAFLSQLGSFSAFLGGGGIGLSFALGNKILSRAILITSMLAPFATYFIITSFLKGNYGAMCLVTSVAYGCTTAAMLIPAISEFDVAIGRTTLGEGES